MLKFFKYKWAVDGETTAVPNAIDPSGFVSYRQGYGADYSRVYGTDPLAKAPERVKLNAVLQDITAELQSLQVHGYPDYITSALNDGSAYAYDIGAVVRWTDDKNYRNTVAGNTNDPSVSGWVLNNDPADAINSAPTKATPIGADKIGIWDSVTGLLNSVSFTALTTYLTGLFAPIDSPAFTGTPTAKDFAYKQTPITITSWSYVTTTITLNVASHTFVVGDYIEVDGLTATTNAPNGVHQVTSVTATTIVFTYGLVPTGTAGVSSATVKGYMTTNGRVEGVGIGQTWQDVTGNRVAGTIYTNTTGKPIQVFITALVNITNTYTILGTSFTISRGTGQEAVFSNIVPNGATYSASAFTDWLELR